MFIDHANLAELFVNFKATFQRGFDMATPMWNQVAMEIPSTTSRNRYDWLGMMPGMRQWIGDRAIQGIGSHGFQIENLPWELTLGVEREKLEDDEHGIYSPLLQTMGDSAAMHKDELVFNLMNLASASATRAAHTSYDDVAFFGTTHPYDPGARDVAGTLLDSSDQDNLDAGGSGPFWYLLDLSKPIKPFILQMRKQLEFVAKTALTDDNVFFSKEFLYGVDARYNVGLGLWQQAYASNQALDATHFESAMEAQSGLLAPNGKPMRIKATHLVVPTSLEYDAKRLLNTSIVITSGDATDNIHRGEVQLIVGPWLTRS